MIDEGALRRVLAVRGLRGLADGFIAVLLARHLVTLGFSATEVGLVVTTTLLGSATLTIAMGFGGGHRPPRTLLLGASGLMFLTGIGFAGLTALGPLLVVAAVGTLNPSGGDVSVFVPVEQALLASKAPVARWPALFGTYNLAGTAGAAAGALASALPDLLAGALDAEVAVAQRAGFGAYAAVAVVIAALYRGLPRGAEPDATLAPARHGRRPSRAVVELTALFSLDSAGSGFAAQAIVVLWLERRFGLSAGDLALVFFGTGLLGAASQLLAAPLAARVGLVRTMVLGHLPANVLLVLAGLAPSGPVAVAFLLLRSLTAQLDVPARQAFVMAAVPAPERAAAASLTNVPRSLAGALTPAVGGALLAVSGVGWPLVAAGVTKAGYDLLLLRRFGPGQRARSAAVQNPSAGPPVQPPSA